MLILAPFLHWNLLLVRILVNLLHRVGLGVLVLRVVRGVGVRRVGVGAPELFETIDLFNSHCVWECGVWVWELSEVSA